MATAMLPISDSRARMICLLAATLALSVGCFAQAPRVLAQKLCDQMDQAYANHDLNQVLGFYDASYVSTDERGNRAAFAEVRKQLEQSFPQFRNMNSSTVVQDVQLEADRMVVHYKQEQHFVVNNKHYGWAPVISKATGETTWERKSGQWKMVRSTTFRADVQFDPKWVKEQLDWIDTAQQIIKCNAPNMVCR